MTNEALETNKAVATQLFIDVFDHHDLGAADAFLSPDVVFHNAGTDIRGVEGWKAFARDWLIGFPNTRVTIDFVMAEDDQVLYHWRAEGTHTGEFRGRPATGRHLTASGLSLCRLESGKIREIWDETEAFGEFERLTIT
jgi:steroid delta-isomerase-like uncharacterized protein